MDFGIRDKIALVTGGSYGIGHDIAITLAREGCRVAICARGRERLENTATEIRANKGEGLALCGDARNPEDIRRIVNAVNDTWGGLHILVNNVGGGGGRTAEAIENVPASKWQEIFELNTLAAVRFTMGSIPYMQKSKWGRVITIASRQGREGGGRPWYTMAKSAEISLMKTLALNSELVRAGITFNSVAPGRVIFPGNEWDQFRKEDPEKFQQAMLQRLPLGRAGTPQEVASVVAFLCSQQASLVNGACIAVDGGESYSF